MSQSKPYPSIPGKPAAAPAKPGAPVPGAAPPGVRPGTVPSARPGVAPTPRPGAAPAPANARPGTAPAVAPSPTSKPAASQPSGRVVHDKRGNAVWDWLAQTSRMAIESTTRLLRKLETPELKMEQTHEEELRIDPDNSSYDKGGGYDPYNQPTKPRK